MFLVILFIGIVLVVISIIAWSEGWEATNVITAIFAVMLSMIAIIGIICCLCDVVKGQIAQDKIEMYQEQNEKIEADVATQIENYVQYETKTFTKVDKENALSVVELYPNLKSNTLVQQQIQLHIDNINKINDCKSEQIKAKMAKWWIYFGN